MTRPWNFGFNAERIKTPPDGVVGGGPRPPPARSTSTTGAVEDTKAVYTLSPETGCAWRRLPAGATAIRVSDRLRSPTLDREEGYMP